MYPEKMPRIRPGGARDPHNYIRSEPRSGFLDARASRRMVAAVVATATVARISEPAVVRGRVDVNRSRSQLRNGSPAATHALADPGSETAVWAGTVCWPLRSPKQARRHRHRPVDGQRRRHDVADADHIFGIVTVIALVTAGIVIIRRALAPLRRVVQTASGEVVDLPLDRGEVKLPVGCPEPDANLPGGATQVGGCSMHCRRGRPVKPVCASSVPMPVMNCELPLRRSVVAPIDARWGRSRGRRTR